MVETDTHTLKCYGALKQSRFSTPLRVEKVPEGGMRSLCLQHNNSHTNKLAKNSWRTLSASWLMLHVTSMFSDGLLSSR